MELIINVVNEKQEKELNEFLTSTYGQDALENAIHELLLEHGIVGSEVEVE